MGLFNLFKYKHRPLWMGKYPMEQVKRVDKPTTRIDEKRIKRVPLRASFFKRPHYGDLGEHTKEQRARFVTKSPFNHAMAKTAHRLVEIQDGPVAEEKAPGTDDPTEMYKHIKSMCYFLDADLVGVCEMPEWAWYSHDEDGNEIKADHKYAIVLVIDQGFDTMEAATGDDWISSSQSQRAYLRGAEIGCVVAEYIRKLGYGARVHSNISGQVQQVPLMLLAGLGELSRIGEVVLNPFIGPRVKSCVITTDLPMDVDKPIDFGLQKFCSSCYKCARECPCNAIPFGDKIMFNGYEIWKPDVENCAKYRINNPNGSACGRCMKTCPLNKVVTERGPLAQRVASWLGINAMWLKPVLIPIAVWLDDVLMNGKQHKEFKWWLDLEIDPQAGKVVKPKGVNEKDINPKKKPPKEERIAIYEPEDNPPPDYKGAFKTDRKAALEKGKNMPKAKDTPWPDWGPPGSRKKPSAARPERERKKEAAE